MTPHLVKDSHPQEALDGLVEHELVQGLIVEALFVPVERNGDDFEHEMLTAAGC